IERLDLSDHCDALDQLLDEGVFKLYISGLKFQVEKGFDLLMFSEVLIILQLAMGGCQLIENGFPCIGVFATILADVHAGEVESKDPDFENDFVEDVEKQSTVFLDDGFPCFQKITQQFFRAVVATFSGAISHWVNLLFYFG